MSDNGRPDDIDRDMDEPVEGLIRRMGGDDAARLLGTILDAVSEAFVERSKTGSFPRKVTVDVSAFSRAREDEGIGWLVACLMADLPIASTVAFEDEPSESTTPDEPA